MVSRMITMTGRRSWLYRKSEKVEVVAVRPLLLPLLPNLHQDPQWPLLA